MVHMHHTLSNLAQVVGEALGATGLSDREIERRTGLSRTTLARRLADGDFKFSEATRIAKLLDVDLSALVRQAEERAA